MSKEFRVVAVVQAKPGHEEAVADILRAATAPSRAELGCLFYTPHADLDVPGRFTFIERWVSQAALDEHCLTPHFTAMVEALGPHIDGELELVSRLDPLL